MIENHLGRRSVSDFQRGVLALRKKEILQSRSVPPWEDDGSTPPPPIPPAPPAAAISRQTLAREARISSSTLGQIEKIQKAAAPELVRAVKDGAISINAAAAVSSLPPNARPLRSQAARKNYNKPPEKFAKPRPRHRARRCQIFPSKTSLTCQRK